MVIMMDANRATMAARAFCCFYHGSQESKYDDEVWFCVEAAAFEAVAPVVDAKHDLAEFVLIVDGNDETVVDTTDCVVVVFDVTGFDNKLNKRYKWILLSRSALQSTTFLVL